MDVSIAHPLIDAVGPGFVVSETDAAVVALSSARMGLVLDARAADVAVVLLTPSTSRITTAMLAMRRRTSSAWVVREGDRYRAAGSITVADDVATAMLAPQSSPRSSRLGTDEVAWTEVVVSVHHRAAEQTTIGRPAELLLEGLAGVTPSAWGSVEPATLPWSVAAVTDFARRRAPRPTRAVASAAVAGGFAAVEIRVDRSATGVTEETRLALPRTGGAARVTATGAPVVDGPVADVLADLARRQRVLLGTAWRSGGHPDATLAARQLGMPVPLGARWLQMKPKPSPRVFTITAEFDRVIGRRFKDGVFTDEKQMWMQLLWDKGSPGGFVVRTAYPTRLEGWHELDRRSWLPGLRGSDPDAGRVRGESLSVLVGRLRVGRRLPRLLHRWFQRVGHQSDERRVHGARCR
ncbi:DUF6177 family protein [Curtobacterium sp. VKM Ac-2922]|uniref:DUF6177 family protein n=1 Tax=Curtobacterium sp. VKM Ac-2922 TaxID=2929475 RepID=UPI001FB41BFF|nr:DUF6177 family protein [Curtobacterium sp. VKM Ac-2922]MCJ1712998.1 DUF6177 family protein [Curtobacterium sp. VKM Ac-2922]